MDRFQSFKLFVRVVENGSFSLTAKETSISQATVSKQVSDALTDLVRDGIDLALKVGDLKDSTHLARRLGSSRRVTVASPAFVAAHGAPIHPADLAALPCLVFLGQSLPFEWKYRDSDGSAITVSISGNYRADATEALREAAIAGLGVYRTPLSTCGDDILSDRLVRLLKDFEPEPVPFYAVTPNAAFIPEKTRVFVDFLREQLRHSRWISQHGDDLMIEPEPGDDP